MASTVRADSEGEGCFAVAIDTGDKPAHACARVAAGAAAPHLAALVMLGPDRQAACRVEGLRQSSAARAQAAQLPVLELPLVLTLPKPPLPPPPALPLALAELGDGAVALVVAYPLPMAVALAVAPGGVDEALEWE